MSNSGNRVLRPIRIGRDEDWAQVALGEKGYAIARKLDGTLWAWGSGLNNTPTLFSKDNWRASGWIHGIKNDGTLWLLGDPSQQVGRDSDWIELWDGTEISYALKVDGSLWQPSWGWDLDAPNVRSLGTAKQTAMPKQIISDMAFRKVAGNQIALKTDGTLWKLGVPMVQVGTDADWVDIAVGESYYALKADGSLWSWGEETGSSGSLGYGIAWSAVPVPVVDPKARAIETNDNSSEELSDR